MKDILLKYKYIIFFFNFFSILNFINFYSNHDIYTYIGLTVHTLLFLFYLWNFKKLFFNKRKIFFLLILLLILFTLTYTIKIKYLYSLDEELIFFRDKNIKILISYLILYFIISIKNVIIPFKRIIKRILFFSLLFFLILNWGNALLSLDIIYPTTISYKLMYFQNYNLNEFGILREKTDESFLLPGEKLFKNEDQNYYPIFPLLPAFLNFASMIILKLFCIPFGSLKLNLIFAYILRNAIEFYELLQFQKLLACLISFFTTLLFYYFLKNFQLSKKKRLFYMLLYGIGSIHWSISSLNIWQHSYIEFFNLILLFLFIRWFRTKKDSYLFLVGILQGILFYIRPTTIFISVIIDFFVLYNLYINNLLKDFKRVIFYLLIGASIVISIMGYLNYKSYGNPIGGYFLVLMNPEMKDVEFTFKNYFNNFSGILFSPNYGIFAFHPYFFIGIFIFIYYFYKNQINFDKISILQKQLLFISILVISIYILFYSSNVQWTGFYNYGPRMFSDILVYMFILFILIVEQFVNYINFFLKKLLFISYGLAFFLQFYGNYSQHLVGDWYCDVHQKRDYDKDIEHKIWDIKDPLFLHKIWYRSKPIFLNKFQIEGSKICTDYFSKEVNSYLFFDFDVIRKQVNLNEIGKIQDLPKGILLFYYYLFFDEKEYTLNFYIENLSSEEAELRIYTKNFKKIQEFKFFLHPKENIITISLNGSSFQEKISFFAFSESFSKLILKKIEIIKK